MFSLSNTLYHDHELTQSTALTQDGLFPTLSQSLIPVLVPYFSFLIALLLSVISQNILLYSTLYISVIPN